MQQDEIQAQRPDPVEWWTAAAVFVGFAARIWLMTVSIGSNDAVLWSKFAQAVQADGLAKTYAIQPWMNHPLLPVLWASAAWKMTGTPGGFCAVFKIPAVLADALCCVLLLLIGLRYGRSRKAFLPAVVMALNPVAIMLSAYHGNTDSIYAALGLLGFYFIDRRRAFFLAGLALGAALNIKLLPVVLIAPAMALCLSRRELIRLIAGLAIMAIPFVALFAVVEPAAAGKILGYTSLLNRWGIMFFLVELNNALHHGARQFVYSLVQWLIANGRYVVLGSSFIFALTAWKRRAWNAYEAGALAGAIFLVVTPGFGVQYLAIVVPLLIAADVKWALAFTVPAGTFLAMQYAMTLEPDWPLESKFASTGLLTAPAVVALFAWAALVAWVAIAWLARLRRSRETDPPLHS